MSASENALATGGFTVDSSNVNTRPIPDIYQLHFIASAIKDFDQFRTNEWYVFTEFGYI